MEPPPHSMVDRYSPKKTHLDAKAFQLQILRLSLHLRLECQRFFIIFLPRFLRFYKRPQPIDQLRCQHFDSSLHDFPSLLLLLV